MTKDVCTLLEFSKIIGGSLAYVRRLHRAGRLVMADSDHVQVSASLARLGEEGDGAADQAGTAPDAAPGSTGLPLPSYNESRARREHFLALAAERDYRQSVGELAPVGLMEEVLARTAVRCHALFNSIPAALRTSNPALTASDLAAVDAVITKVLNAVAGLSLKDVLNDAAGAANQPACDALPAPQAPSSTQAE